MMYVFEGQHQPRFDERPPALGVRPRFSRLVSLPTNQHPHRIEDGLGRYVDLAYETGRVSRVTDQGGRAVSFLYYSNLVSELVDPAGGTNRFDYMSVGPSPGLLTKWTRPLGNAQVTNFYAVTNMAGNPQARVISQTDAYGNTMLLRYVSSQPQTHVVYPDATTGRVTSANEDGLPVTVADAAGTNYSFGVSGTYRLRSVTDRLGNRTGFGFETNAGTVLAVTNPLGRTLSFEYTPQSQLFTNPASGEVFTGVFQNVSRVLHADGSSESFGYDARGNLVARTNRAGRVSLQQVNAMGLVTNRVNPAGGAVASRWATNGVLLTWEDPETGTTTFQYDGLLRLTNTVNPDGSSSAIRYDAAGRVTGLRDELGRFTAFTLDANGNLQAVTDAAGSVTGYGYDLMDRALSSTDRLGRVTSRTHNSRGDRTTVTDPNGLAIQYAYDSNAWLSAMTVGGQTWRIRRDLEGLKTADVSPLGFVTGYGYDGAGALVAVTNPLGQVTRYLRDTMNRLAGEVDPLGRTNEFHYDAEGVLTGLVWSGMGAFQYRLDAHGRADRITDPRGQAWDFTRSAGGRLQAHTDPLGNAWGWAYDVRDRVRVESLPGGASITNHYDAAGNLTRRAHSGGGELNWAYDSLDRLTAADGIGFEYDAEGRVTNAVQRGVSFAASYDAGGRLERASYNGGAVVVTYRYDPITGLLTNVSDSVSGGTVWFQYDNDARLVGLSRGNGQPSVFTWDAAGRLTHIQEGVFIDLQYALDAAGQITQAVTMAPLDPAAALISATDAYGADAACQVGGGGFAHDGQGRLTAAPGAAYAWDGFSRLTNAGGAALRYNGVDQVTERVEAGQTNRFFYHHGIGLAPVVAEQNGNTGAFTRYYVWTPDGALLYGIDVAAGNQPFYYHFDVVGTTLALSDAGGAVADAYACDPHGRVLQHTGSNPQPFVFVGRYGVRRDSGTLYQMRARYYDAKLGRFLSREPLWPRLTDGPSLNPYAYAANSPVSKADISGRTTLEEIQRQFNKLAEERSESLRDEIRLAQRGSTILEEGDRNDWQAMKEEARAQRRAAKELLDKRKMVDDRIREFLKQNREAIRKLLRMLRLQLWDAELALHFQKQDAARGFDDAIRENLWQAKNALDQQLLLSAEQYMAEVDKLKQAKFEATNPQRTNEQVDGLRDKMFTIEQMLSEGRRLGVDMGDTTKP